MHEFFGNAAAFVGRRDDVRLDEDDEFGAFLGFFDAAEEPAEERNGAEEWRAGVDVLFGFADEAAGHHGHAVLGDEGAGEGARGDDVDRSLRDGCHAFGGVDWDGGAVLLDFGVFLEEAQGNGFVGVDVGRDEEHGADVFVFKFGRGAHDALTLAHHDLAGDAFDDGVFLAVEDARDFVIRNEESWGCEGADLAVFLEELDARGDIFADDLEAHGAGEGGG